MKNFAIGLTLVMTVAIPLYAQAKPAAPTATNAVPVPAPTPARGSGGEPYEFWKNADFTVSAWGTFNYSVKSTFTKAVDSALVNDGTYMSAGGGATAWYGNKTSQVGFSASYLQIYNNTATVYGQSQQEKLTYIPMLVYARYYVLPGLWAGVGGGYALGLLKVDNGSSTTKVAGSPMAALRAGYDYAITRELSIGGFLDLSYTFLTINQQIGLSSAANYSANSFNITPGISVNYTF